MQLAPSIDPVAVWASYSFAPNFGLWPTPSIITGGDKRNAANLTAADQALTARTNLLGNRVALLNSIDGSVGDSSFTAGITTYNAWDFKGTFVSDGATARFSNGTGVFMFTDVTVGQGFTLHIGTNAHGIGQLIIDGAGTGAGSNLLARFGANIIADGTTTKSSIKVQNGAELAVDSTSTAKIDNNIGVALDPGANALYGTNLCKCWGVFTTDGAGNVSLDDGYGVASVSIVTGVAYDVLRVTFAHAMANTTYLADVGVIGSQSYHGQAQVRTTDHVTVALYASVGGAAPDVHLAAVATTFTVMVMSRQ